MSTTALVRSPSSTNTLSRTASGSSLLPSPSQSQQLQSRSTTTATSTLPNVTSTPPQSQSKYSTPTTKTPTQQTQQPSPAASQPTPGRWQHPRMEEILERQNRTNFDGTNVRAIIWNIIALFLSFFLPTALSPWLPHTLIASLAPWPTYSLLTLRLFTLFNIGMALSPLFRKQDPCEDIPLTPAQRQLFGLPPLSRPATPQEKEQWVTPPRYSRSASGTPRSSSSSLRAEVSGSPIPPMSTTTVGAGSPFGSGGRRQSGSPMTPGGTEERRSLSLNRGNSPLSISEFEAAGNVNSPTKNTHRASVGLNSKWLYEKGRASPTGTRLSGSGWGTGSVFT